MPSGNIKNLVPNEARSPEERRRNAQIAGKASAKARRRKAKLKEMIQQGLDCTVPNSTKMRKIIKQMNLADPDDATVMTAIVARLLYEATIGGDIKAIKMVAELIGQTPYDERAEKKLQLLEKEINANIARMQVNMPDNSEPVDDGFIKALSESADSDWTDDEKEDGKEAEEEKENEEAEE